MKKYACVLEQLFDGLCIPGRLQVQVEGIFSVCRRRNQRRKLVFIIGFVTPKKKKRVAEKDSGHSSDHLIFPRKKKSINEREIKK